MAHNPTRQRSELSQCSRGSPSDFRKLPDNCLELIFWSLVDACPPGELAEVLGTCKTLHRAYKLFAASSSSEKLVGWVLEYGTPATAMTRLLKMGLADKLAIFAALAATGHAHNFLAE